MEEFRLDNKYYKIHLHIHKSNKKFVLSFEEKETKYNGYLRKGEIIKGNFHFINCHYYLLEPKLLNDKEFKPINGIEGYKYIELMKFSHNMFLMENDNKLLVDAQVIDKDFNFNSIMIIGFNSDVITEGSYKLLS